MKKYTLEVSDEVDRNIKYLVVKGKHKDETETFISAFAVYHALLEHNGKIILRSDNGQERELMLGNKQ